MFDIKSFDEKKNLILKFFCTTNESILLFKLILFILINKELVIDKYPNKSLKSEAIYVIYFYCLFKKLRLCLI